LAVFIKIGTKVPIAIFGYKV